MGQKDNQQKQESGYKSTTKVEGHVRTKNT